MITRQRLGACLRKVRAVPSLLSLVCNAHPERKSLDDVRTCLSGRQFVVHCGHATARYSCARGVRKGMLCTPAAAHHR